MYYIYLYHNHIAAIYAMRFMRLLLKHLPPQLNNGLCPGGCCRCRLMPKVKDIRVLNGWRCNCD